MSGVSMGEVKNMLSTERAKTVYMVMLILLLVLVLVSYYHTGCSYGLWVSVCEVGAADYLAKNPVKSPFVQNNQTAARTGLVDGQGYFARSEFVSPTQKSKDLAKKAEHEFLQQ